MRATHIIFLLSAFAIAAPASAQTAARASRWAQPDGFPSEPAPSGTEINLAFLQIAGASVSSGVLCGGSIIADGWVLTAAHCVFDENCLVRPNNGIGVRTGAASIRQLDQVEERISTLIYPHPEFKCIDLLEQVRRLRSGEALPIGRDVALIYVPKLKKAGGLRLASMEVVKQLAAGQSLRSLGWGKVGPNQYAVSLQQVRLALLQPEVCAAAWRPTTLTSDTLCGGRTADDAAAGSCAGDSGGPVVDAHARTTVQFGIVSAGNETCGDMKRPSIFISVGAHQEWITKFTGPTPFQTVTCSPPAC